MKLFELKSVAKSFRTSEGTSRCVLDDVNFILQEGEIVALLGKSGSGKSTLLRIIAGLVLADQGDVIYRDQPVTGPAAGISMVFQSFALFPWLTVQQNVELGLEAQGMPAAERQKRADEVLELIGLNGFGGALPRELSGGMRQRVGIARALVMDPDILLMDEAFSALDVLTGENLRDDMLELWDQKRIPTKGILIVSHNIVEAVMMADRILILSSDPGRIRHEIKVNLPRPRDADDIEVRNLVDQVYSLMTQRPSQGAVTGAAPAVHLGYRLPQTDITRIDAILTLLAELPFKGKAALPALAEESELDDEALLPTYEALSLLNFVHIDRGNIVLTPLGLHYVHAETALKKALFGQQLLTHVPLAAHIRHRLEVEPSGALPETKFLELLRDFVESEEAERVLGVVVEWGRYGEVFEYDFHTGRLRLPEENAA
ncbi:MAG TPA: nitrate/sulfonate/bicarbonate ABC transporter ATP-binding protein [Pseudomonadales bacterium]|nr:nitrate/sulfonate/bicarbonate ABC transporter ATP-binding protein [Pseudomonadales bacterium]